MENISKEEHFDVIRGVKIALKTLIDCFVVIMFIILSLFVLFPKISLKLNEAIGAKKIQEYNYQLIYSRSNSITDLYNLIIYEESIENQDKELYYIDKMLARNDYENFCKSMDKASLSVVTDTTMIPYSANVNGYLQSRKVICMFNQNKAGIDTYVYSQTKQGKLSEYTFSSYVDLIYLDKTLSESQKREKISDLLNLSELKETSLISLEQLLDERIAGLKNLISLTQGNERIVYKYTLMRIYCSRYYAYSILGDEESSVTYLNLWTEIKTNLYV